MRCAALLLVSVAGCAGLLSDPAIKGRALNCQREAECASVVEEARRVLEDCPDCPRELEAAEVAGKRLRAIRGEIAHDRERRANEAREAEGLAASERQQAAAHVAAEQREAKALRDLEVRCLAETKEAEKGAVLEQARRDAKAELALKAAETRAARQKAVAEWVDSHCKIVKDPIYETKVWVDKTSLVHAGRVVAGYDEAVVCPASSPDDIVRDAPLTRDERGRLVLEAPIVVQTVSRADSAQIARRTSAPMIDAGPACHELRLKRFDNVHRF